MHRFSGPADGHCGHGALETEMRQQKEFHEELRLMREKRGLRRWRIRQMTIALLLIGGLAMVYYLPERLALVP